MTTGPTQKEPSPSCPGAIYAGCSSPRLSRRSCRRLGQSRAARGLRATRVLENPRSGGRHARLVDRLLRRLAARTRSRCRLGSPGRRHRLRPCPSYRQAGAATTGACVGGALALRSRRWREIRLAAIAALTFDAASVGAALVEIAGGNPQPVAFVILGAAAIVTVGMALALQRAGR